MSEPKRHHYIPQFQISNFARGDYVLYWNAITARFEMPNTENVFLKTNLYTDKKNNPDDPTDIEKKFSAFESQICDLLKAKFLDANEVVLTRKENENLRKYLFLLSYRNLARNKQYKDKLFDDDTKKVLASNVENEDYGDLWLRELRIILDLEEYPKLDGEYGLSKPVQIDLVTELEAYFMTIVETRGQDFLLTDIYPTTEMVWMVKKDTGEKAPFHMHSLFPISPSRMILLNNIMFKKEYRGKIPDYDEIVSHSKIGGNAIFPPTPHYEQPGKHSPGDTFCFSVKKIYEKDVIYINQLLLNECRNGFVAYDFSRVTKSIEEYRKLKFSPKKDYSLAIAENLPEKYTQ